MDALSHPVLSCWAPDDAPRRQPDPAVPGSLARLPGCAPSPDEALRRARGQFPGRDVLLLRADAVLPADALRRLAAAWHEADWDVLSPIDGRWPVFPAGLDDAARDALAWTHGEHAAFDCAHVSPVCSLWRGQRPGAAPAHAEPRHGLLPCLYVGPVLGDSADEMPLPLARLAARLAGSPAPVVPRPAAAATLLHVLHSWGGGIERFARDLAAGDATRRHLFLTAQSDLDRCPFGRRLCLHDSLDAPPLRTWTLAQPIDDTAAHSPETAAILAELVGEWGVGAVLVSSLIGHSLDVLRTGLPTALCVHDAYPAWPLLHDVRDPAVDAFDEAALARGLAEAGPGFVFPRRDAASWFVLREQFMATLAAADVALAAPSDFARRRLCTIAPALAARRWQVIPHGFAALPAAAAPTPRTEGAPLRVLVPGRIHGAKGEHLIDGLLATLPAGVELVLLGGGRAARRFAAHPAVQVIEDYARDDLPAHVAALAPDLALLPGTVPETFSYVLSEMLSLGLPVLCASPGAPAERLAAGGGWTVAAAPGPVAERLAAFAADRAPLLAMRAAPRTRLPGIDTMAAAWNDFLPASPGALRLPAAHPEQPQRLALETSLAALRTELGRHASLLAEHEAELARRADWAFGLQRELEATRARLPAPGDGDANAMGSARAELLDLRQRLEKAEADAAQRQQQLADGAASLDRLRQELEQSRDEARRQLAAAEADAHRRLADANAETRRLLSAAEAELRQLRGQLEAGRALAQELKHAQADLRSLGHDLDDARVVIARLEDYIHELDRQLADAHGYYQRDSTDLAQQRDVALQQRDEAQARLDRILGSRTWRLLQPPRRLAREVRNRVLAAAYHARHLRTLFSRGLSSLRNRGLAGTWQRLRERRAAMSESRHAVAPPLPLAGDRALRLSRPKSPRASIVVPVYNQLHYTLACLRALADCGDTTAFEVIVVDDGSSDGTPRVLPSIPGLVYHRNARNLGFVGACNAGAELARGEYLVFLNNDTTVQPGWLDKLLATFGQHPDTGLAGSKLVYPDGRLQEAGGIVFADGSGWNWGRFEDPAHPRYNFVREVDYCSGAAIALRRELFMRLGGFDNQYAPAYYEDTDLAMRVREHGLKVRYQPASVVVHHEGATAGTDTGQGVKAYQVANQKKFLARWRDVLAARHQPAGSDPALASERGRRWRVLVLDACTPTPDRDSGSLRMFALLRLLREEGCAVTFFPENRAHDGTYTEALQQLGVEAWWHPPLADVPRWLAKHGPSFDLVVASRHYVLSPLLPLLREHAPQAHLVFDTVDLHHLRELREAELSGDPAQKRTAARTRRIELDLIGQCDTTWVVSGIEKELLAEELPAARVEVVSNIHEVNGPGKAFSQRQGLMFVGSYRHPPNVDAALWLAREIFPRIRERLPGVELQLVGGDAPEAIVALGEEPGIRYHGYVPDLVPLLEGVRVALAPLRYGAGVKGKVNQSLSHGQPVVATRCAVEGMHLVDGVDALVADEAEAFADAVVRLYRDEALWTKLSLGGLENTRRYFSSDAVRETLRPLLASLPRR